MRRLILSLAVCLMVLTMSTSLVYADMYYVVQPGDTLYLISLQFGVSQQALITANHLTNPNLLYAGQILIIPAGGTPLPAPTQAAATAMPPVPAAGQVLYRVKAGDTLYALSRRFSVSMSALMVANGLNSAWLTIGQVLVVPSPMAPVAPVWGTPAAPVQVVAAPTVTPQPTAPPAPPASATYYSHGIRGDYFWTETNRIGVAQQLWFDFKVTNTGGDQDYGVLSIHSDSGPNGASWTNSKLKGGDSLEWRDHIQVGSAGTYGFYLAICYSDVQSCRSNQAPWERLSATTWVTISDNSGGYTGYTSRGVVGQYFYVENMTSHQGDKIWFDFKVTNTAGGDVNYSVLSAVVSGVKRGISWSNAGLKPSETLEWRDHMDNLSPGTYAMYLGICYAGKDACMPDGNLWDRLSDDIFITVVSR